VTGRDVSRLLYNKGKLDTEKIRRLESIQGWHWDSHDSKWDMQCQNLVRVMAKLKGHVPKQTKKKQDQATRQAAKFANNMRTMQKQNKLSPERQAKLAEIAGWTWLADTSKSQWEVQRENLRRVMLELHGQVPKRNQNRQKATWKRAAKFANNQRTLYKQKKLSSEQQDKLLEIPGWTWTAQAPMQPARSAKGRSVSGLPSSTKQQQRQVVKRPAGLNSSNLHLSGKRLRTR